MSLYWDRIVPPEVTLASISPYFEQYGITRLGKQTSLDTIGIPVFAAFRPNAATLATAQGKGLTDAAAKASAAMEAIEFAVAENPECDVVQASAIDLRAAGIATFISSKTLPAEAEFPRELSLSWVRGTNIMDGSDLLVPLDLVRFSGRTSELRGICQHTNGLASGNSYEEALFHGLCELIERDAGSLWALSAPEVRARRRLAVSSIGDGEVSRLAELVSAAGLQLLLFDQTTDLAVPTTEAGARCIGLIDGYFGWTQAVWHKEILFSLDCGVTVLGGSSLGALRAAECQQFGMVPVGQIAAWYCDGTLDDDGEVALMHYPAEAQFAPYSEALVDVKATLANLLLLQLISPGEHDALLRQAQSLNFRERTVEVLVRGALAGRRASEVLQIYEANRISLKAQDAIALIDAMRVDEAAERTPRSWAFVRSFPWREADF